MSACVTQVAIRAWLPHSCCEAGFGIGFAAKSGIRYCILLMLAPTIQVSKPDFSRAVKTSWTILPCAAGPGSPTRVSRGGVEAVRAAQSAERPKRPAKRSALKKISWSFYVLRFLAIDHILYSRIANTFEIEKVHPLPHVLSRPGFSPCLRVSVVGVLLIFTSSHDH